MSIRTALSLCLPLLALAACQPGDDQETGSISREDVHEAREALDPEVVAALDQGNAAYRDDDYEAALRHYETAAELDDDVAAAWFGIYMANLALGNAESAESAMERARELAPGATLMHPDESTP